MLTIQQANEQLQTAYQKNPGPWVEHSRSVAENARRIAEHTDCINPDTAYTMGLRTTSDELPVSVESATSLTGMTG